MAELRVELLTFADCPHAAPARLLLREVLDALAPAVRIVELDVATPERAAELGFRGSPSIRVGGRDVEGLPPLAEGSLCCRLYDGAMGVPPRWMIEVALLRALGVQSYLFLCVANSARSQLAEGLARRLAPPHVRLASAGSAPTTLRPEAVAVLAELGIDSSAQRAKRVDELDAASVQAVITLCAEEVCPVFLGQALRVHWPLPDPAATAGGEQQRQQAFRAVRDELRRRLTLLFGPQQEAR